MSSLRLSSFLITSAVLFAADPRIGTWRQVSVEAHLDPPEKATFTIGPDEIHFSVNNGTSWSAKPDGRFYPVTGSQGYDQIAIRHFSSDRIETVRRKAGHPDAGMEYKLDHAAGMLVISNLANHEQLFWRRSGAAGPRDFEGEWALDLTETIRRSPEDSTLTITAKGREGVHFHSSSGLDYTAALDGTPSPVHSQRNDAVRLRRIDQRTVEEAWTSKGKVTQVLRYTVSPDGQELSIQSQTLYPSGMKETQKLIYRKQ